MEDDKRESAYIDYETADELNAKQRKNKYQNWIDLAKAIDAWRIFPRIFISVYIYLVYAVVTWYMALETPSIEQSGLVSVMTGVGAAWFGSYTKTRGDGDE